MDPARDLGLQHALRNGIALLDGRETGQDRARVLDGLLKIVSDADRGSGSTRSLTFAVDQRSAFERYSLFVRYLAGTVDDLPVRLAEAKDVLERVGRKEELGPGSAVSVGDLLRKLLSALERDRKLKPLATVRDVHYN